jgi:hypothetical protein
VAANGTNGTRATTVVISTLATLSVSLILALIIGYQSFAKAADVTKLEERLRIVEGETLRLRENVADLQQQIEEQSAAFSELRAAVELLYRQIDPPSAPIPRG